MRLIESIAVSLAVAVASTAAVHSAPMKAHPALDATYDMSMPEMEMTQRRISDGKGHERVEMNTPQGKMVTIRDVPARTYYTLVEHNKTAIKNIINPESRLKDKTFVVTNDKTATEVGAEPIGKKVIAGHPCHGYRYTQRGGTTEAWIGDDIKTLVYLKSVSPKGAMTMTLKSAKPFDGNDELFQVPSGYKVVEIPKFSFGQGMVPGGMMGARDKMAGDNQAGGMPPSMPSGMIPADIQQRMQSLQGGGGMSPEQMEKMKQFAESMRQRFGTSQ